MAKTARTAMDGILTAIKADYVSMGTKKSYHAVGLIWHISSGTAWRMITRRHWPTDSKIRRVLMEKARGRGIEIKRRIRVELDTEIGEEDLKAIREMSVKVRTEVLINFIKEE